jgi:hypothetical protein
MIGVSWVNFAGWSNRAAARRASQSERVHGVQLPTTFAEQKLGSSGSLTLAVAAEE